MIIEQFPEEWIELNKELCTGYHPKLESILSQHAVDETDIKLAQIAAYCEVLLDGTYTLDERSKLCDILRQKLILLRDNPNKSVIIVN